MHYTDISAVGYSSRPWKWPEQRQLKLTLKETVSVMHCKLTPNGITQTKKGPMKKLNNFINHFSFQSYSTNLYRDCNHSSFWLYSSQYFSVDCLKSLIPYLSVAILIPLLVCSPSMYSTATMVETVSRFSVHLHLMAMDSTAS